LITSNALSHDAKERIKKYQKLISPLGAYTSNSKGFQYARDQIAQFIAQRDNIPVSNVDPNNIYLTNGASEGVRTAFSMLIRDE